MKNKTFKNKIGFYKIDYLLLTYFLYNLAENVHLIRFFLASVTSQTEIINFYINKIKMDFFN